VLNALAAIGVGLEIDVPMEDIRKGLRHLGGLARRFQIKGDKKGVLVLDDYGHHPTEIAATLLTAKDCWPDRRLVVVFQPHRYTRTHLLFDRFMTCFNQADVLILAPLYGAGEKPIEGVDSQMLSQGIKDHGHRDVVVCRDQAEIVQVLEERVQKGDVVMTLGAGDIYHVGERLLEKMDQR